MAPNAGMYCVVKMFARFPPLFHHKGAFHCCKFAVHNYIGDLINLRSISTSKCVNSDEVGLSINLKKLFDSGNFYLVGDYL